MLAIENTGLDAYLGSPDVLASTETVEQIPSSEDQAWQPLLDRPNRFIIIGLNYHAHCAEIGADVPERLIFAIAPATAITHSGADIDIVSDQVDYEGEIGLVIGQGGKDIEVADAWQHIFGITPLNDVSARDIQAARTREAVGQAKGFPGFKPIGPCLATPDEFADKDAITLFTSVNGEQRQTGHSGDMIFGIAEIVSLISQQTELKSGDVICTGTPGGVAHGGAHPYLKPGDEVRITVGDLPPLVNRFREVENR